MLSSLWCLIFGCALSNASAIFYRCFQQNTEVYNDTPSGNATDLMKHIDPSMPTAFFIHGWKESCHNDSAIAITSALLSRGDHNVCCLDWSVFTSMNYFAASPKTHEVAEIFAKDISGLHGLGLSKKEPHLIGFSLGAHVAGGVGKIFKAAKDSTQLRRITGLDAALPLFYPPACSNCSHLESTDADFVDCIHTDGGVFGVMSPIGTCDFYPNGGNRIQKTCPSVPGTMNVGDILPTYRCSHDMSWRFYKEAIEKPNSHIAIGCKSSASFEAGSCSKNPTVSLGLNMTNTSCSGTYYYATRSTSPYGAGNEGTRPN